MELDGVPLAVADPTRDEGGHCGLRLPWTVRKGEEGQRLYFIVKYRDSPPPLTSAPHTHTIIINHLPGKPVLVCSINGSH